MTRGKRLRAEQLDKLVKAAHEANSTDRWWEFADDLLDEVPDEEGRPSSGSHVTDGSRADLEEIADVILDELGILYSVKRLAILRATARAWPFSERDPEVEFAVHERLRGSKGLLPVYKRRAAADYKRAPGLMGSPRLTEHRLKNYRADERPAVPWAEQRRRTLRSVVTKAGSLDTLDELEGVWRAVVAERRAELDR